jgi:hypothetical protein
MECQARLTSQSPKSHRTGPAPQLEADEPADKAEEIKPPKCGF